ncbi:hypothetical protein ACFU3J_11500 [Streptomyces sp. NPDC057411]|uniref:hypothetical protein n=1 Tax=unclassified Streptomyces TaxID=2593676 RepID=UPI0036357736
MGAAKIIDRVLHLQDGQPTSEQLLRLLVLRADVADPLGEKDVARSAFAAAAAVHLTAEEQVLAHDDLVHLMQLMD